MFLNGDDGAGFFNSCTSLFNAIVAFYDADLNGIIYPWGGGGSTMAYILYLLVLLGLLGSIYKYLLPC